MFAGSAATSPTLTPVTVSASDVAAVLWSRLPGLSTTRLHTLLYYCQGHHLATFGRPLFREGITARDVGPVVVGLWHGEQRGVSAPSTADLTEAELNTVGHVLSRYSELTEERLRHLARSSSPWRQADAARSAGRPARIEPEWMRVHFTADAAAEAGPTLDAAAVADWLRDAGARRAEPRRVDSREELRRRLGTGD